MINDLRITMQYINSYDCPVSLLEDILLFDLKGHCHEVSIRKFCSEKALPELSAAIMEVSGNILFCI